jgi:hydroxyethylthiazole kinase
MPQPSWEPSLHAVVERAPLVHCLTNIVVAGFTANVLLALGASPAMVENAEEAGPFAAIAGGVLVNLGTLAAEREVAMRAAASSAHAAGRPWVLDPVAVGALAHRTRFAGELLEHRPTVIRGNASEIASLAGVAGAAGKGVDSSVPSAAVIEPARALARSAGAIVAVSGVVDYVTDGDDVIEVPGGDILMTRVTGVGCALGAMMAAFAAVVSDPLQATVDASAVLALAGSRAANPDRPGTPRPGPGTFAVRLLDILADLAATATTMSSTTSGPSPASVDA